jgi:hypothetical protein
MAYLLFLLFDAEHISFLAWLLLLLFDGEHISTDRIILAQAMILKSGFSLGKYGWLAILSL